MKIGLILNSLKDEVFTGSCSLACENHLIDLVLREGNILLASCDSCCGNPAMDMITTLHDQVADASLSDLTQAQMKLTLEFNAQCKVNQRRETSVKPQATPREERKSVQSENLPKNIAEGPAIEVTPPSPAQDPGSQPRKTSPSPPAQDPGSQSRKTSPSPPAQDPGSQSRKTSPSPHASAKSKSADIFARDGEELAMVDRDLNALDSMDLDTMSDKIRKNCKAMVEKLHLEHLMENPRD